MAMGRSEKETEAAFIGVENAHLKHLQFVSTSTHRLKATLYLNVFRRCKIIDSVKLPNSIFCKGFT